MEKRHYLWAVILFTFTSISYAEDDYFQQFVHYTMDVKLDIEEHTIGGKSIIEYLSFFAQ